MIADRISSSNATLEMIELCLIFEKSKLLFHLGSGVNYKKAIDNIENDLILHYNNPISLIYKINEIIGIVLQKIISAKININNYMREK